MSAALRYVYNADRQVVIVISNQLEEESTATIDVTDVPMALHDAFKVGGKVVGITLDELAAVQAWNAGRMTELLRARVPLLVSDLADGLSRYLQVPVAGRYTIVEAAGLDEAGARRVIGDVWGES